MSRTRSASVIQPSARTSPPVSLSSAIRRVPSGRFVPSSHLVTDGCLIPSADAIRPRVRCRGSLAIHLRKASRDLVAVDITDDIIPMSTDEVQEEMDQVEIRGTPATDSVEGMGRRRSGKSSLSPKYVERVLAKIREIHYRPKEDGGGGGIWAETGRLLQSSPQSVEKWISGTAKPSFETAELVAKCLRTDVEEILFGDRAAVERELDTLRVQVRVAFQEVRRLEQENARLTGQTLSAPAREPSLALRAIPSPPAASPVEDAKLDGLDRPELEAEKRRRRGDVQHDPADAPKPSTTRKK